MTKDKKIKQTISKLKNTLMLIEGKFKKQYFLLDNIPQEKFNQILVRNLHYFNMIVQKVRSILREIMISKKLINNKKLSKKLKNQIKIGIHRKSLIALVLLKHLTDLLKKYSIENFDFEIQTLIENDNQDFLKDIPNELKNEVKEEFQSLKNNITNEKNVIETFGIKKSLNKVKKELNKVKDFTKNLIKKIADIFKSIFSALNKIFGMLNEIVQFLLKTVVKFIKLLQTLLVSLMKLITVIIPKLISKIFSFIKLLYLKVKKIGIASIFIYFAFNILINKYWELLLDGIEVQGKEIEPNVPELMITVPAIIMTSFFFWAKTKDIENLQNSFINSLIDLSRKSLKFLFIIFLGFPENDKFFKTKSNNVKLLIGLFFSMLYKNISKIVARTLLFSLILKISIKFIITNGIETIPTFKEIILFPLIFLNILSRTIFRFISKNILIK